MCNDLNLENDFDERWTTWPLDCKLVLRGRAKLSVIEWDSIEAFVRDKLAIDYANWWLLNLANYGNWFTVASVSCLHFVLAAKTTTEEFIHEGKVRPSVARWSAREITTNEECEIMVSWKQKCLFNQLKESRRSDGKQQLKQEWLISL